MHDGTLPVDALERIDGICREFEAQWQAGKRPLPEAFVRGEGAERDHLLQYLLLLDLDYRTRGGDSVAPDDYASRFPDDRKLIMSVFARHEGDLKRSTHQAVMHTVGPSGEQPVPAQLGRYRVDERLGAGGFGAVYRGFDQELQRAVAIKVPHRRRLAGRRDPDEVLNEARAVASLDHPAIVPVYDVGRNEDGICYIVSKYMPGGDLAAHARKRPLSPRQSAAVVAHVALGLHHAHRRGLVHRDVKISNILIDDDGRHALADFGLALRDEDVGRGGGLIGTPAAMSPEQARGEGHLVDGRTDVYGLGVVLYELLAGVPPFRSTDLHQLLSEITTREPKPPRQIDDQIPRELEHICLKALAKRASDRYTTAKDMADDLRDWIESEDERESESPGSSDSDTGRSAAGVPPAASHAQGTPVVPKGLHSFDQHDADFYLALWPGPRDRHGLPESVRFWKARIESRDAQRTFRVGLLYGPSGGGKSSFVKAGLLPQLSRDVRTLHIEASADDTEEHLLRRVRAAYRDLPEEMDLVQALKFLRQRAARRNDSSSEPKLLLVVDQFEQWLHVHDPGSVTTLGTALRQCDGLHVQALLLVRDDFWMPVTRFMRALEQPLSEGRNAAAVDLFDAPHARQVLLLFGQALGRLPADEEQLTPRQSQFLDEAVACLGDGDDRILPVRLSLLVEMLKSREWEPGSVRRIGGSTGLGRAFLEGTFSTRTASPGHRLHQSAARSVLRALLPQPGSEIRGHLRSRLELLEASGYRHQPAAFDELMGILDTELRLVTPTDPSGAPEGSSISSSETGPYFQLTHDYLVPSLREWLTESQRATRRGRAQLRLDELSRQWQRSPEKRFLPGALEYLSIRTAGRASDWTAIQRDYMRKSFRFHAARWSALSLLGLACAVAVFLLVDRVTHRSDQQRAATLVESLARVPPDAVPFVIDDLERYRSFALPELRELLDDSERPAVERLHAALGIARLDEVEPESLLSLVPYVPDNEAGGIVSAVVAHPDRFRSVAKRLFENAEDVFARRRLAILLLQLDEPEPAAFLLRLQEDPSDRTGFIHGFGDWYFSPEHLPQQLRASNDPAFQSGICAALGRLKASRFAASDQSQLEAALRDLYRRSPEAGVHSAAGWALRQWNRPLGELDPDRPRESVIGNSWFVDSTGLTMVRIPGGTWTMRPEYGGSNDLTRQPFDVSPVSVTTSSFYLSDCEVTAALFRRFADDPDYPVDEKPEAWNWERLEARVSPEPDCPVQGVSWEDAVLFCNWLSHQSGRTPYYSKLTAPTDEPTPRPHADDEGGTDEEQAQEGEEGDEEEDEAEGEAERNRHETIRPPASVSWVGDPASNGFRLPSEAQWEYACRAGTTSVFYFGDDDRLLPDYGFCSANSRERTWPVASLQPNPWGLFDMHGNVSEWCADAFTMQLMGGVDPVAGPDTATSRIIRGGNWYNPSRFSHSANRAGNLRSFRPFAFGFRVALPDE